jgi:predicted transcriptional regulator
VPTATVNAAQIPAELLERPQWVVWRYEERDGDLTKVPYQAMDGQREKAASDKAATWTTFLEAFRFWKAHEWVDGVGFVFSEDDPYFGIDLDKCRDPDTGVVEEWAVEILDRFDGTYAEWSVSGRGVHIIGRGTLPGKGNRKRQIEVYDRLRYFTMSGDRIPGRPEEVADCQEALNAWHGEVWPPKADPPPANGRAESNGAVSLDDYQLLERMFASKHGPEILRLWSGDVSGYDDDDSRADLALCSHLIWWTNGDAARVDRLFRQSSLYRPKWERADYRERTIGKGLEGFRGGYEGPGDGGRVGRLRLEGKARVAPEVPSFPTEALPGAFRALVEQAAAALPCPPDFVAVPLLVAAGAAIGNGLELRLRRTWAEGPNLYAVTVGEPGSKKSPAQRTGVEALHAVQKMLAHEYAEAKARYEQEMADWKKEKGEEEDKPVPPTYRHVLTTDVTVEALAPMLVSSKGIAVVKDELSGWVAGMNQYKSGGRGADRQHYLSMWSRSGIKVDRKNSPVPVYVPLPCLSVVGGIQPELIWKLANEEGLEDGFLDRLLWSFPDHVRDEWSETDVDEDVREEVEVVLKRLYRLQPDRDLYDEDIPRQIRFGFNAADLWRAWYEKHSEEWQADDFPSTLRGPWAKMPGQLARIALILHAAGECQTVTRPIDEISGATFKAAETLIDYFKAHARRVYGRLPARKRGRDEQILDALKQRGQMTQTQISVDVFQRNVPAEEIKAVLEMLEESGLVTRKTGDSTGGRKPTIWTT